MYNSIGKVIRDYLKTQEFKVKGLELQNAKGEVIYKGENINSINKIVQTKKEIKF